MAKSNKKAITRSAQQRIVLRPKTGLATVPGTKAGKKRQRLPVGHPDRTHQG